MKRKLPHTDEYYRLNRARSLRRKAARWERLRRLVPLALALWIPLFLLCWASHFFAFGAFVLSLGFVGLCWWGDCGLPRRIARLRYEALALEEEHQARYGSLAALESPAPAALREESAAG
jgi:hypothetical protein